MQYYYKLIIMIKFKKYERHILKKIKNYSKLPFKTKIVENDRKFGCLLWYLKQNHIEKAQ
jgi:hypothetical protein